MEDGRFVMGTVLDVALRVAPGREVQARSALARAFEQVEALDRLASRHDPQSALARLNARAGGAAIPVDPSLHEMLRVAEEARTASRGAFDIGVGPLVLLWTEAARRDRRPSPAEIDAARARVAPSLGLEAGRVRLEPGASVDLGGLAKGYALDRMVATLAAQGFTRGLMNFGGSSQWAGGQLWRLRVEDDGGRPLGVVELRDQALSMSSSLSQSSVIDGVAYGHVVDPRSGEALRVRRSAVVVARTATCAEILSTALLVLDESEGRAVVQEQGAEAWVLRQDGSSWETPGWRTATHFQAAASEVRDGSGDGYGSGDG